jgi:hypothetical protein
MGNRDWEEPGKLGWRPNERGKTEGRRVRDENAGSGAAMGNGSPR